MANYYAVTRRGGRWVYVCSGDDPESVYREAVNTIDVDTADFGGPHAEEDTFASEYAERQLDRLRVVPAVTARQMLAPAPSRLDD